MGGRGLAGIKSVSLMRGRRGEEGLLSRRSKGVARLQGSYFKFYLALKFKYSFSSSLSIPSLSISYSSDFSLLFSFCIRLLVGGGWYLYSCYEEEYDTWVCECSVQSRKQNGSPFGTGAV